MIVDPRTHRHVRKVEGNTLTYVCGCVSEIHGPGDILWSASKCAAHKAEFRHPYKLDHDYFVENGAIVGGIPQCAHYVAELEEALGYFPDAQNPREDIAIEFGCGYSMYCPAILQAGYQYLGIDASERACKWTKSTYCVETAWGNLDLRMDAFSGFCTDKGPRLILAAHVLEHLSNPIRILSQWHKIAAPKCELWLIVPDNSDPINPDHKWFFNTSALAGCLEGTGWSPLQMATRQHIARENFIYCKAAKI